MITADELRQVVRSLPEAEERQTWGHPTFRVRDRMFAAMSDDGQQASVKATRQEQAALVSAAPAANVTRTVPMFGLSAVPAISACQRSQRSSAISRCPSPAHGGQAGTIALHRSHPFGASPRVLTHAGGNHGRIK